MSSYDEIKCNVLMILIFLQNIKIHNKNLHISTYIYTTLFYYMFMCNIVNNFN